MKTKRVNTIPNAKRFHHEAHEMPSGKFAICLMQSDPTEKIEIVAFRDTREEADALASHLNVILDGVPRYDK